MRIKSALTRSLVVAVALGSSLAFGATEAGAQEVDVDFCTNFYPELCLNEDGDIDPNLFPTKMVEVLDGYFLEERDARYDEAVAALARHRAGDDTDKNGVPDSPEIAVCGAPGCLPEWAASAEVTEPEAKVIYCCDGIHEPAINAINVDISEGMNQDKLVSVMTLSTPVIHYVGAYPAGGKVEVRTDPPVMELGVHRIVAVGTADGLNEPEVKVWRLDVLKEEKDPTATTAQATTTTAQVAGQTQSTTAATTARTGADVGKWVMGGAALVLLGTALVVGARRRRHSA